MLACVFFCQPLGYCMATIVTMAALGGTGASPSRYRLDCAWRWVIGIGVFFAIVAAYYRRKIPESPRFTADVLYRAPEALQDYETFIENKVEGQEDPGALEAGNTSQHMASMAESSLGDGVPAQDSANENEVEASGSSSGVPTSQQTPRHAINQSFESRWNNYWTEFGTNFPASFQSQTPILFGVSFCWCMLDLIYYALLGPGSSRVVKLFITENNELLFASTWKVMILLICGSLGGGLLMIFLVKRNSPRFLQMIGFATVTILILIFGVVLIEVKEDQIFHPWGILFYITASISFEVGANFTTFMLPAELFPTRHRAFAVGIAAASGKFGAVVIQPFVRYVTYNGKYGRASEDLGLAPFWVGFATVSWIGAPIFGLLATYLLIPETRLLNEGSCNQELDTLYTLSTPMQDRWEKWKAKDQSGPVVAGGADESSRTSSTENTQTGI
jgi:PHS family inorganic phosphate transporter-like MFS transporter